MAQAISKMETTQTAVDWLMEQMLKPDMYKIWPTLLEQAKAIEKDQCINDYKHGQNNGYMYRDGIGIIIEAEQYYKETYGS